MPDAIHPLLLEDEENNRENEEDSLNIKENKRPENMTANTPDPENSETEQEQEQNKEQPQEEQPVAEEKQEEEESTNTEVETSTETEEEEKQPETQERPWFYQDDPNYIVLDRRNLGREYVRYFNEDKNFRAQASTTAGRQAKREAQQRIDELEQELAQIRRDNRTREVQQMSQEDIAERMANDPQFAREYTDLLHPPETSAAEFDKMSQSLQYEVEDLWDEAIGGGLPQQRISAYQRAISSCPVRECPRTEEHGFFDHNPSRSEPHRLFQDTYGNSAPAAALARLQAAVRQEINETRRREQFSRNTPTSPPPTTPENNKAPVEKPATAEQPEAQQRQQEAGKPNPKLVNGKPDISGGGSRNGGSKERLTREDVRNMSWEERIARWEEGEYENDVKNGVISIPGINT